MRFLFMLLFSVALIFLTGCSIGQKSWGAAGSSDAFKVTLTDKFIPEVVAGGGANALLFQRPYKEEEKFPAMFAYSRRKSMWGMFSSDLSAGNVCIVYIAGSNESPAESVKIIAEFVKMVCAGSKMREPFPKKLVPE